MSALLTLPTLAYPCPDCQAEPGHGCLAFSILGNRDVAPHESRVNAADDRLCPDCLNEDALLFAPVPESDIVLVVCDACGWEDAL